MVGKKRKSGEDANVAGLEEGKRKVLPLPSFVPVFFSCSHFLNSADLTISEPGTG